MHLCISCPQNRIFTEVSFNLLQLREQELPNHTLQVVCVCVCLMPMISVPDNLSRCSVTNKFNRGGSPHTFSSLPVLFCQVRWPAFSGFDLRPLSYLEHCMMSMPLLFISLAVCAMFLLLYSVHILYVVVSNLHGDSSECTVLCNNTVLRARFISPQPQTRAFCPSLR